MQHKNNSSTNMSYENSNTLDSRMPAEWEKHDATWCCFPFNEENWYGYLHEVRIEYSIFIQTIAQFEPVHLLCESEETLNAAKKYIKNVNNITFHIVPLNDIWFRDNGPTFVIHQNKINAIKWKFNAWGNKFPHEKDKIAAHHTLKFLKTDFVETTFVCEGGALEVNGQGVLLTTKQCVVNQNREHNLTTKQIEKKFEQLLGTPKCIWLEDGLENDHTDGHIDTIVRFVSANKILCSYCNDKSDLNHTTMEKNLTILKNAQNLQEQKFEIELLPLPQNKMYRENERLACTYANFYIGNGFVIVPIYDDPNDEKAVQIIQTCFPDRKVVGLMSKFIIHGGGSFHCLTQQQPSL